MQITPEVITALGTAVLTIGGMIPVLRTWAPKVGEVMKQDAPMIAQDLNAGIGLIQQLAESPLFSDGIAKGTLDIREVTSKFDATIASSEAKSIIVNLGKTYAALSPSDRVKAEVMLRMLLSDLGVRMTDAQIENIFTQTDQAISTLRNDARYQAIFGDVAVQAASPAQGA